MRPHPGCIVVLLALAGCVQEPGGRTGGQAPELGVTVAPQHAIGLGDCSYTHLWHPTPRGTVAAHVPPGYSVTEAYGVIDGISQTYLECDRISVDGTAHGHGHLAMTIAYVEVTSQDVPDGDVNYYVFEAFSDVPELVKALQDAHFPTHAATIDVDDSPDWKASIVVDGSLWHAMDAVPGSRGGLANPQQYAFHHADGDHHWFNGSAVACPCGVLPYVGNSQVHDGELRRILPADVDSWPLEFVYGWLAEASFRTGGHPPAAAEPS